MSLEVLPPLPLLGSVWKGLTFDLPWMFVWWHLVPKLCRCLCLLPEKCLPSVRGWSTGIHVGDLLWSPSSTSTCRVLILILATSIQSIFSELVCSESGYCQVALHVAFLEHSKQQTADIRSILQSWAHKAGYGDAESPAGRSLSPSSSNLWRAAWLDATWAGGRRDRVSIVNDAVCFPPGFGASWERRWGGPWPLAFCLGLSLLAMLNSTFCINI